MLSRPALSILQNVYIAANATLETWAPLSGAVRAELRVAAGLLITVEHTAVAPPLPREYCSDASLKGYALHVAHVSPAQVMDIAGWRERWRVREIALEAQGRDNDELKGIIADMPTLAPDFQRWVDQQCEARWPKLQRTPAVVHGPRRFAEGPEAVPPLPSSLLSRGRWRRVIVGAWRDAGSVHFKEGRASLMVLRREARAPASHGLTVPSLGDNMSELLAQDRGRAADHALNALCRRSPKRPVSAPGDIFPGHLIF